MRSVKGELSVLIRSVSGLVAGSTFARKFHLSGPACKAIDLISGSLGISKSQLVDFAVLSFMKHYNSLQKAPLDAGSLSDYFYGVRPDQDSSLPALPALGGE